MTRVPPRLLKGEMESSIQQFLKIWLFIIAQLIRYSVARVRKLKSALKATLISVRNCPQDLPRTHVVTASYYHAGRDRLSVLNIQCFLRLIGSTRC
jgi:hypothetical protein